MTIVDAYYKYNEMKAWYDEKVGAFLTKIQEIDRKINKLKQDAVNAVGPKLKAIQLKIQKFISKIQKFIQDIQDFIASVEQAIEDWITKKIEAITKKITDDIKKHAELKAQLAISEATNIPMEELQKASEVSTEFETENLTDAADYDIFDDDESVLMTFEQSNKDRAEREAQYEASRKLSVSDLTSLAEGYGVIDDTTFSTKHFKLSQYCYSSTAAANNINNNPSTEHKANLQALNDNIVDPLIEKLGSKFKLGISSGYRCDKLNKLVGGAAKSQHRNGEAVDLIVKVGSLRKVFKTLLEMNNFDQLIWEHSGGKKWIHVSFKRVGDNRHEVLDYNGHSYTTIAPGARIAFADKNIPDGVA